MNREEAIEIIKNEKECVNRANKNDYCNRDCYNCELVKTDKEIIEALDMGIEALENQKTGHWINKKGVYGVVYCSECDYELHTNNTNFCANCGAKMEGEKE